MISVEVDGGRLVLESPYHPGFSARARRIGGRWDPVARSWSFDARDEARVRELCVDVYGTDGESGDVLTIRAPACVCETHGAGKFEDRPMSFWLAGRLVARAYGRDSGASLGDGVVVLSGGFSSGGSVKNPCCTYAAGTVFELRDVPRRAAEAVHAAFHGPVLEIVHVHGVALLDSAGAVVAEPTAVLDVDPVGGVSEPRSEPVGAPVDELASIEVEIAAAEGRLAGLRFRLAEIAA